MMSVIPFSPNTQGSDKNTGRVMPWYPYKRKTTTGLIWFLNNSNGLGTDRASCSLTVSLLLLSLA